MDLIRQSFSIVAKKQTIGKGNQIYRELWTLFEDTLKRQQPGTCADITNSDYNALMAVPFWTWYEKHEEVLKILSKYRESDEIQFAWNLIKNHLSACTCIFSGERVEITARLLPIDSITSFSQASRRVFLSATLNEDAFLVKDMGILPESVANPLSCDDVPYSGERLIILPSLVDSNLQRGVVLGWIQGIAEKNGSFGVVVITPSRNLAGDWKNVGSKITDVTNLQKSIDELKFQIKENKANSAMILLNEYDGVDLPDSTCRILVLDSLPSYSNLMDNYLLMLRPFSGIIRRQLAQRVEQGMGRAIRSYVDWCIVIVTGADLTSFLADKSK